MQFFTISFTLFSYYTISSSHILFCVYLPSYLRSGALCHRAAVIFSLVNLSGALRDYCYTVVARCRVFLVDAGVFWLVWRIRQHFTDFAGTLSNFMLTVAAVLR